MIHHTHHQDHAHHSAHTHIVAHAHSSASKNSGPHKHKQHKFAQSKTHKAVTAKHVAKTSKKKAHHHTFNARAQANKPSHNHINVNKFTHTLAASARHKSTEKCAKHVRLALESAGANVTSHPVAAADWGHTLEKIGYRQISPAFDSPRKGDIYIIGRTRSHEYGHIAGYTGSDWVSDFKQNSYAVYSGNATYKYYRLI
ncbi:peptidoglycan amidohydrolase family protein [Acinetobacter nectaris]|uniref:peptidoglycan amidohydrolase family protein n=1 Tax=Acinetobacter nectaris TaxID=1219382 RepID=UPI001F1C8040|nr:peptidoglycan amidohydrolase family protein [Acinetobacter nectaris]MCF9027997.1 CHAP domain-containing protein [Acinetobacter nectaris]